MRTFFSRGSRIALAAVAALALTVSLADARVGGGSSSGSRGSRTFQAPSGTNVAPRGGSTIDRTMSQPGQQSFQRQQAAPGSLAQQPRRFGFGTGLFAGLLGDGLLGMMFGGGFLGGLSGLGSFIGLLLQVGLIVGLIWLAVRFFRRRSEPAYAGAPGGSGYERSPMDGGNRALGGLGLGGQGGSGSSQPQSRDEIGIGPADYDTFERLLGEIQSAFSREDLNAIRRVTTPEMASYMAEQVADNARKGVVNEVSGVKLVQGDLSEAWRDPDADYATVAMRFSLTDVTKDRASGRIVEGSTTPGEVSEVWTFRRAPGDDWKLSAIQQA